MHFPLQVFSAGTPYGLSLECVLQAQMALLWGTVGLQCVEIVGVQCVEIVGLECVLRLRWHCSGRCGTIGT